MAKTVDTRRHAGGLENQRTHPPPARAPSIEDACTCTVCREAFAERNRPSLVPRFLSSCGHTICTGRCTSTQPRESISLPAVCHVLRARYVLESLSSIYSCVIQLPSYNRVHFTLAGCLAQLIGRGSEQANNEIICPFCRTVTSVPNGDVTHLPSNWSVIALIPYLDHGTMGYNPSVCQMGCSENPVVYQCKECQEHMCASCAEGTVCRTGSSHHLEEVNPHTPLPPPSPFSKGSHDRLCPKHNLAMQFVCSAKENALLCFVCQLDPEHKGHEHVSLNAYSERKNEVLQILLRDLKRKQRDFVYGFNFCKRTEEELMQEKERIHNQLKKVFGQLEEAIRIRKEDLCHQIDAVVEQKLKLLDQEAA